MSTFSNKKVAKQKTTPKQIKQAAPPQMLKKMKLIQKNKGRYVLEVDEAFVTQLQSVQQFLTELNDTIHGQPDASFAYSQESNQQAEQNQVEEEGSSSGSEEKSAMPPSNPANEPTNQQSEVKETQDFYRRIPHFFMGRFKKWAKILKEDSVSSFLNQLKSSKKSKQGRYELGDFHRCFQIDKNETQEVQQQKKKIKELFLEFLQNEAVLQIIQYNKITNQEQKIKYIDVIPNMVQEMYSDKPFDQFLAQQNIQKQINKKQQLLSETLMNVKQEVPQQKQDQSFEEPAIKLIRDVSFKSEHQF